jgi:hypothetical protein
MGRLNLSYPQSDSRNDTHSTYIGFEQSICDARWEDLRVKMVAGPDVSYHAPGEVPL